MLIPARPEEGRGGTADGDEGGGTDGAAQGGGSDKGNGCGGHDGASVVGVVVGITRVIMTIMKVAYTHGNIVILCPDSFKCIDPQFPKVNSAGIVVLSLEWNLTLEQLHSLEYWERP